MIVISDTGPLNYLILIGHVDVLEVLYGSVVIPPAVAIELSRPASPDSVRSLIQNPPSWLSIAEAPFCGAELTALGDGEKQAIALASLLKADLLLCDDKDARNVAIRRGLGVVGTLGVLDEAAQKGLLDLAAAVRLLRHTNFRITPALIEKILENPG